MIQHVTRQISPAKLESCVRFYAILGFEPVAVPPSVAGRAVWLARPDADAVRPPSAQIHLMPSEDARPEQGHVAFVLDGYEAVVARLREAGFEVEARRQHWGAPRAYVRDPAANLVELMAAAPDQQRE
jgi:catechol 2,3-dioxygenase-like lactoylglutathione lyase family enzyme